MIGVQWHAETLVHREAEAELFRRFVAACRDDGVEYERAAGREVA
jgi:gamma-glutamyl-gamma-aminobutyrate hydrolase PuuD